MRTVFKIAKTELRDLFYSPIAWLILIIFTFQTGMYFADMIAGIVKAQMMGGGGYNITAGIFAGQQGLFVVVHSYLYLYIPLLTMGLMSRELGSGSIKLLYSSPITNTQIVLGKYLAMMIYGLVLIAVLAVFSIYGICTINNVDTPVILTGLLGVYFLLCAYVAIGLFMSSLTSYQIVAAVGTLAVLAVLTYVKGMWQSVPFVREITYWFGLSGRSYQFLDGMVCTEDILYFLVVISLFLFMTIIRMQGRRQRVSWAASLGKYAGIWGLAIVLAYVSSRPIFIKYWDVTATQINTLTPNSQDIINRLKGGLKITTYANILDINGYIGYPANYNADIRQFVQYVRFKPEIELEYVLYYDTVKNDRLERAFPGLSYEEKAKKVIEMEKLNPKKVLTPEQVRKQVDLTSTEGNRTVRLIERESGEKIFLRLFDDMYVYPFEPEISAALKRMVMTLPTVGFLTGHGERETDEIGDRNYGMFSHMPSFRQALINQGFDYAAVTLDKEVPEDINILVIGEMKTAMTEVEKVNFDKFVARGGNLLIAGEPSRRDVMNPLMEEFGVKMMEGVLVLPPKEEKKEENENNMYLGPFAGYVAPKSPVDLVMCKATKEAVELSYPFKDLSRQSPFVVAMSTVTGFDYTTDKGFDVVPLLQTDSTCWNELETTNFVDEELKLNPAIGEVQKSYATCLGLSRKMGDRVQKIILLSDADCISDGEVTRQRTGVMAANYSVILAGFNWLSDGEAPIDVRRPRAKDNVLSVGESGSEVLQYMLIGVFPALLLFLYLFIWMRRRGR